MTPIKAILTGLIIGSMVGAAMALSGCSFSKTFNKDSFSFRGSKASCILAGAEAGAIIVGGAGTGIAVGLDCGPGCVEHKIAKGESIHESVQHHVNRRDDALLYGVLPGVVVGAAIGGAIGAYMCRDDKAEEAKL